MFALPTAINTHGPGLSDFLKINKPQLLCENVFVKCKILPIPPYETFSLI
jgi:hypothetical protein